MRIVLTGMAAATASKKKIFISFADLFSAEFPLPGLLLYAYLFFNCPRNALIPKLGPVPFSDSSSFMFSLSCLG